MHFRDRHHEPAPCRLQTAESDATSPFWWTRTVAFPPPREDCSLAWKPVLYQQDESIILAICLSFPYTLNISSL